MLSADVKYARYTGVAPGTTTLTLGATATNGMYPPYPPPDGGPGVPPYPTQAWWVPEPSNIDRVRIAVPPNQHVTSETEVIVSVPKAQRTMGPVPNDKQVAKIYGYQPVMKSWIHSNQENIYTLQGYHGPRLAGPQAITFQGAENNAAAAPNGISSTEKWAIFASVMGGLALATTALVAILRYRRER